VEIITAKSAGFCFGVKRAIDMAFAIAVKGAGSTVTLGPIIHNPQVIGQLNESGIPYVDKVSEIDTERVTAVIVRTHGIPVADMDALDKLGVEIIDATCPFVKKAQDYAALLAEKGYQVLILGEKEHPEVMGIMSHAGKNAIAVKEVSECPTLMGRVGIVVQTTRNMEELKSLLPKAIENAKELRVYNTICSSTDLKLKEAEELSEKSDIIIVVGGRNSSNTTRLANLCKSHSVPTYHIETAQELEAGWFENKNTVGVTAGASTPDWIIDEVIKRINNIGGS